MSLKHTIELVIKAQDEASKKVRDVENQVKKFSNASKNSVNQVNKAFELNKGTIKNLDSELKRIGNEGPSSFKKLSKSQQDVLTKYSMLDKETRNFLEQSTLPSHINLSGPVNDAQKKWKELNNITKTWSGSIEYSKAKLQLLGTNIDSLKGKLQLVGTSIQTYVSTKWDTVKNKISSVASTIQSKLSGAISRVGQGIRSLGDKFSGLGGIISSVIGGIGMASITDMTVGLAMNRERMTALTNATMGGAKAGDQLLNGFTGVNAVFKDLQGNSTKTFMGLDEMTNHSLVSLDDLGQAMSTIKMSTGMTNEELAMFSSTVNDVGQRAILMGKSGEESITLMQAAGRGLNGEFDMLKTNFGITKETLTDLGWSGAADDVEGYQKALDEALAKGGDMDGMLDTTTGHLETLKKNFRVAGRHVGEMFTPFIDQAVQMLNSLNDKFPHLYEGLVGIAGAVSGFATIAPSIAPALSAFDSLKDKTKSVLVFTGFLKGEEDALTLATLRESVAQKISAATKWLSATATGAYSLAVGVLTGEITLVAAAQKVWNAVMAANPIGLVIVALAALALAVYEVGKYFGWWKDIPSMLSSVWAGIQRLWSAFINNPDVQGFIKGLGDAWNSVTSALGPVITAVMNFFGVTVKSSEEFDIVRVIIDSVGAAFHQVANAVRTAIGVFQTIYGVFQGIASFLAPYGQMIYDFLKPIVCILLGCSPGIVPALEKVQEVFQTVWSFIAGFIGSYVSTVVSVIGTVVTTVQSIVNVFAQLLTGQISLSEAIPMIWNLISNAFVTIGGTILSFITKWAGQLLTLAIRAATNFMNGIVNRIRNLPGKVYGFITSTASRIASGAVNWANNARNAATNTVNSVVNNIQGLPGKVYTEFFNIGGKIGEAASHVIQKAADFANGVKNKVLDILGIHSPGILQEKIGIEFQDISTRSIGEKAKLAYENAKTFASNIISGFESEDMSSLEVRTPEIASNTPTMPLASTVTPQLEAPDTNAITDTVTTAYDTMNNLVGTDLQDLQYMNTQSFNNISLNEETMMKKIYSHVNSTLSTILKTNKTSLNQNTNTTKTQLSKMRNSTTTVTGQMVKAWNSMRTSIVSSARKIDSDATAHFNTLGKTIGGFYGKLQNPSRWGTGPGPKEERRGTGRGSRLVSNGHSMRVMSSRLANATMRENHMPRTITVRSVQNNPVLKGLTDFISDGSNIDVRTLFETGVLSPFNLGGLSRASFGAWENTAKPNIDKIKKTARNWSMKGPRLANRVSSGLTFHLKDFENGTPRIGMNDFINMAYALVNSTSYGYYANSERYGSWLNALNHGVMNCSDGSDMLIALARTCGLPASKVHCYWGTSSSGIAGVAGKGEGHFVARIGGRIMDSVSMRHGSLTSPKVHGYGTGPSPFKSLRESNNDNYIGSDDVQIGGKLEIIHKHEFEGLPQGIDEAKLARMINDAPNNERFVKQLANNVKFQIADHRAKVRFERKGNRSKGLGA